MAVAIDLSGKSAIVFGVANHRSIAWAIARQLHAAGAHLTVTYQNERFQRTVSDLVAGLDTAAERIPRTQGVESQAVECDVMDEAAVGKAVLAAAGRGLLAAVVHSVAFANREDLEGDFSKTGLAGFRTALEVSAYSLITVARQAAAHMAEGGCVLTLSFHAAEKVYPGYNIMGVAKAALENEVRQLAAELGPRKVRVNAISAGPLSTLAARGIAGFGGMQEAHAERAPLRRNITQDEVGAAALFLVSPLASGITGVVLYVDAGYHIMGV